MKNNSKKARYKVFAKAKGFFQSYYQRRVGFVLNQMNKATTITEL